MCHKLIMPCCGSISHNLKKLQSVHTEIRVQPPKEEEHPTPSWITNYPHHLKYNN